MYIPSISDMYNGVKEGAQNIYTTTVNAKENFDFVVDTTADIFRYFKTLLTDPGSIIKDLFEKFIHVSPDIIVIVLIALIILKFLGFENLNKYIALTLVIALFIALL